MLDCWFTGAVGNETEEEEVRSELENITDAGIHSEHFPVFQLIPKEMLQNRGKNLKLLPNELGQRHTKVSLPEATLPDEPGCKLTQCQPSAGHVARKHNDVRLQNAKHAKTVDVVGTVPACV